MKKIIITGATGFIGKNLLQEFDFSMFEVTLMTRNTSKLDFLEENTNFHIVKGDLNDVATLSEIFKHQDILINLAAEVRNSDKLAETNILGTENILEAIKSSSIKKIIHLSSVGVVGKSFSSELTNVDEKYPETPGNEYERTKLISEKLLLEGVERLILDLIIFRPTNVFGEFHPFNALLNLMQHVKTGKSLLYAENAVVNYIYVKDLAFFIYEAISNDQMKGVFNTGKSMLIKDFYLLLKESLHSNSHIIKVPKLVLILLRKMKINKLNAVSNQTVYDDTKLKHFFSYKFGIENGIKSTIEFYKQTNKL